MRSVPEAFITQRCARVAAAGRSSHSFRGCHSVTERSAEVKVREEGKNQSPNIWFISENIVC